MADIFEEIWALPSSHVKVTKCDASGNPLDATADVAIDEQNRAGNSMNVDNAPRKLIPMVRTGLFSEPTFATLIPLLGHYTAPEGMAETPLTDATHGAAVDAFLDAVIPTEPVQKAKNFIKSNYDTALTDATFRAQVKKFWFEPFTNKYGATVPHCVGFEHVFVGESTHEDGHGPSVDNVGGYHSWVKFYLDEQANKANYLGHDYGASIASDGIADPNVASVIHTWKPSTAEGGDGHTLFKKPGGFLFGTRPECEIALGTVGVYAVLNNDYDNTPAPRTENHRRVVFGTNAFFLVCHPQTITPPGAGSGPRENGWFLRTLYAKFLGNATATPGGTTPGGTTPGTALLPSNPHNDATIRIHRAMPNPVGAADDDEWVEIKNISTFDIVLTNWYLADDQDRRKPLSGTMAPGETKRVMLDRSTANSMMLRNAQGWVLLFQDTIRRAAVRYTNPGEGNIVTF